MLEEISKGELPNKSHIRVPYILSSIFESCYPAINKHSPIEDLSLAGVLCSQRSRIISAHQRKTITKYNKRETKNLYGRGMGLSIGFQPHQNLHCIKAALLYACKFFTPVF